MLPGRLIRMNTVNSDDMLRIDPTASVNEDVMSRSGTDTASPGSAMESGHEDSYVYDGPSQYPIYSNRLTEPYQPYVTPNELSDLTESAQNAHNHSSSVILINDGNRSHLGSINSVSRDAFSDLVRVDIHDAYASATTSRTIVALRNCKKQVLVPLWRLLQFVGWRSFGLNSSSYYPWKIANVLYTLLILSFLLMAYIYQVLACQWKLDVKHEPLVTIGPPVTKSDELAFHNLSKKSASYRTDVEDVTSTDILPSGNRMCDHVITTYVIPNVLHFVAYWLGFYHFRVQNNEELFALSEKVFLYSSPRSKANSQDVVIFRLKLFLGSGAAWMLMAIATHLLYDFTFVVNSDKILGLHQQTLGLCTLSAVLLGIDMIGYLVICAVSIVIILNYAVHAEMIIHFVDTIIARLYERSLPLKIAVKDIYQIRSAISLLNGTIASMTTLIILLTSEMIVIGLTILLTNKQDVPLVWAYRSVFVVHLLPMVLFPMIQAARVNGHCQRLRRVTLEMRTFGYCNASLLELDSVILFIMANKSAWAKLFYFPLKAGYLITLVTIIGFVVIILIQSGVVNINSYI